MVAVLKAEFTMRFDLETHAKIRKIAKAENRSMTKMIDFLVKNEIKRYEKKYGQIELTEEELSLK